MARTKAGFAIWVLLGMAVNLQSPRLRFYMKYMGISFAFICLIELIFHIFNYILSFSWIPQIQSYQMMTVVNSVLMILRVLIIVLFVIMFIRVVPVFGSRMYML